MARGGLPTYSESHAADNRARHELSDRACHRGGGLAAGDGLQRVVLHREKLVDALLGGFVNATVDVIRKLEDAE